MVEWVPSRWASVFVIKRELRYPGATHSEATTPPHWEEPVEEVHLVEMPQVASFLEVFQTNLAGGLEDGLSVLLVAGLFTAERFDLDQSSFQGF